MSSPRPPIRPGDVLRIGRNFPCYRVDDEAVDFLRVHYETNSPGLGHVVEVREDGMVIELWGHLFHTPELATAPHLRRLTWIERFFAPQRLGETLLRREVRASQVIMNPSRPPTRQRLVRAWLRRTRGHLPILEALGGRIHIPALRRLKSWLFYRLGRRGVLPRHSGSLDHGMLLDRIGVTIEMTYSSETASSRRPRTVWLDRILLHKNHSLHLVGIDLDHGEQRTFRLDRVTALAIPPLGAVNWSDLHWELGTFCMSRSDWLRSWNQYQERFGRPLAPPIGRVGHLLEILGRVPGRVWKMPGLSIRAFHRLWTRTIRVYRDRRAAMAEQVRASQTANRQPSRKALRRAELLAEMPTWRRRLLRAIATIEAGGQDQVTCLLPMNALQEEPYRRLAYLRHLVELTLEEAKADPSGHPLAPQLLAEALSLAPVLPRPLILGEWQGARDLFFRLRSLQPGTKRIWVHATRRKGQDARLLLCECFLTAVYGTRGDDNPSHVSQWDENTMQILKHWAFYRTSAYFIARWDNLRFRVESTSAPRLRAILDWWDEELAEMEEVDWE